SFRVVTHRLQPVGLVDLWPLSGQAMGAVWNRGIAFVMRLLAVPLGLAGVVMMGWGLIRGLMSLSVQSRVAQILLVLWALFLVVEALVACWDRLPAPAQRRLRTSWRWRSRWLLRSRPLGLWPVALVVLTALLGFADWFPAHGWSRPMMMGLIASVGIYGYVREKRIRRRPSWLSPMWRDIDSLRRQNALSREQNDELRRENEALARETEQIDQETEQIEQDIEQIDQEIEQIEQDIEQIEQETEILRRQNKALAFLESRFFYKMIRELAGAGESETGYPLDRVDVDLLCEKLVEHGCDERDLPFLLNALDLDSTQKKSEPSAKPQDAIHALMISSL
ncbi:MAG: hypothetical protein ACKOPS_08175, partial [Cyanobium sp.]